MTYDEILDEIKAGLSGDAKTDIQYLKEQADKYKNHELAQEILRACGRMMANCLPDEAKEEFIKLVRKEELNVESVLDEMRFAVYKKEYQRALDVIEPLVRKADENPMFKDDSVSLYFNFGEFFEELIYAQVKRPEKDVRKAEFPFANIYLNYGSLLVELKRVEEANVTLKKALRWNPVNMGIRNEYMETLKIMGKLDEYFEMAVESFKYAYRLKDVGRCFRNLGWYFVEKQMYKEAIGAYLLSTHYDCDNNTAQAELYYIQQIAPLAKEPTVEEMKSIADEYGFPTGPDMGVLQTAFAYGKHFAENSAYNGARYCWGILYELTCDEDIKAMIDELPEEE